MLTLTFSRIQTEDQDGSILAVSEQSGTAILNDQQNRITEKKELAVTFEVETADPQLVLAGANIYVNIALYMAPGFVHTEPSGPPQTGWNYMIPTDVMADEAEMFFYSNGALNPHSCKNHRAFFKYLTTTTFSIRFEFYNTFDENGYLNSATKDNGWRFLAELWNQLNYNEQSTSIYQMEKQIRVLTYIRHNDSEAYSEKQEHIIYQGEHGSYNTTADLTIGGEELTSLSAAINNEITGKLYAGSDIYDSMYVKLIRIQNDPHLDFLENAELVEYELAPTAWAWNGTDHCYDFTVTIPSADVTAGGNYRVVSMVYDAAAGASLAAISRELASNEIIPYCDANCFAPPEGEGLGLTFNSSLSDIENEYGDELTCVIEERIRTKVVVDYADNAWANHLACRGIVPRLRAEQDENDIRHYLKAVTCELYTEYFVSNLNGTVKNRLDFQTLTRLNINTYSSPSISFSFDTYAETLTVYYDFRNRNQTQDGALMSFLDGAQYFPIQDNQYWGGKTIYIKWTFNFFYHDQNPQFQDNLNVIQKIHVKDYSEDVTFDAEPAILCDTATKCYQAEIVFANPETYSLINIVEKIPSANNMVESENFVPDELAQEQSGIFTSQDATFAGGNAQFCIDCTQLDSGSTYKFSAIAKKIQ